MPKILSIIQLRSVIKTLCSEYSRILHNKVMRTLIDILNAINRQKNPLQTFSAESMKHTSECKTHVMAVKITIKM